MREKINLNNLFIIGAIAMLMGLWGCSRKPLVIATEKTIIRDSTVYLPGATVRDTIDKVVFKDGTHTVYERVVRDTLGLATLRIYYDNAISKVVAECKAEPRVIRFRDTLYRTEYKLAPALQEPKPKATSWLDWLYSFMHLLIIILLLLVIVYLLFR